MKLGMLASKEEPQYLIKATWPTICLCTRNRRS